MSEAMIVRKRGKTAILRVVTSTGCSVAVSGTNYNRVHQPADGVERSDDPLVADHTFIIPKRAFGHLDITVHDRYGDNTKGEYINPDHPSKEYEVLCGGANIILNSTFGLNRNVFDTHYWEYSDGDKTARRIGGLIDYDVFSSRIAIDRFQKLTITALSRSQNYDSAALYDKDGRQLCLFPHFGEETYTRLTARITGRVYDDANLRTGCSEITEIVFS